MTITFPNNLRSEPDGYDFLLSVVEDCRLVRDTEITFEQTMEDLLNYWREMMNAGHKFLTR